MANESRLLVDTFRAKPCHWRSCQTWLALLLIGLFLWTANHYDAESCLAYIFIVTVAMHLWRSQLRFTRLVGLIGLLLTPQCIAFVTGVNDYCQGNARLRGVGYPGTEYFNLDPELRCGRTTSGCIVQGSEHRTHDPYNHAVTVLARRFGPMPGTYVGPYPSKSQAQMALALGTVLLPKDIRDDRLVIDGETIQLDDGVGARLLDRLNYPNSFWFTKNRPAITAAVWKHECIILRVPTPSDIGDQSPSAAIAVFSREKGRPFAFYAEGNYCHSFPPVGWKRDPRRE